MNRTKHILFVIHKHKLMTENGCFTLPRLTMKMEAGLQKLVSFHMSTLCRNPKSTAVKVTSSGTFFSGKFALMTYFFQESTVV